MICKHKLRDGQMCGIKLCRRYAATLLHIGFIRLPVCRLHADQTTAGLETTDCPDCRVRIVTELDVKPEICPNCSKKL